MTDDLDLASAINDAVAQRLAEHGCFLQGFVAQIDYVDEDGDQALTMAVPEGQSSYDSHTMAGHLFTWLDELRRLCIRGELTGNEGDE